MFSTSPHVPSIHLPDISYNPYLPPQIIPNMNLGAEMRRRADALNRRRAQREREDENEDNDDDPANDDDWDHVQVHHQDYDHDMDVRRQYDHDYDRHARRDPREAALFRREQEDLEIAHLEGAVLEATRALDDAKRNLRDAKIRRRERRREERQQLEEQSHANRNVPELVRPFVDDVYERVSQPMHDNLSPAGYRSRPPTPQPSSLNLPARSRSPSPYRFSSRTESEMPIQPSQSVHEPQPRSRTPNPATHKEKEDDATSATQEQVYQSFNKLHDLAKEFQALKQRFVYPSILEFQRPGSQVGEVITVYSPPAEFEDDESMSISDGTGHDNGSEAWGSEGKLAYTRANETLHTYSHAMDKLLGKLDSVDSWNETSVRTRRRGIVGDIEQEASKLERYKQKVWRDYLAQENVMYR
ncbi:hypothetical protein BYT27DRAFT_7247099 [Phlegmacium glaucopus]|nr:hypothetical protein BYT27DRAFT_7247099 [Phlegmacium glaucopus]